MKIILDENLPSRSVQEIKDFQELSSDDGFVEIDKEHSGKLDFEIADFMEEEDVMVTGDLEFHKNLLKTGMKSLYYDVQLDNLIEIQVKLTYYLRGYEKDTIDIASDQNKEVFKGPNKLLRKRFDELKKENSELRSRVNVLEGKLKSVLNTAGSALK
ncbi:MAG: hypothetical protein ACQESD_04925 [Thermoplasmatota archaeon]